MRHLTALAGLTVLVSSLWLFPAMAQNPDQPGAYGQIELASGFFPDPHTVSLDAGGDFNADNLGSGCVGYINASAPDYTLYFSEPRQPLNIYVTAEADTTLVVRTPGGSWLCDDDTEGFNPHVKIVKPVSGRYAIWVGTFAAREFALAQLHISELDPIWPSARTPNPDQEPSFGSVELLPGFQPDPMLLNLVAGGADATVSANIGCSGHINAEVPDVWLQLPRRLPALNLAVVSDEDTTLIVATPNGDWLCDDDTYGLNPALALDGSAGRYAIWVGTYGADLADAQLVITSGAIPWAELAVDGPPGSTEPLFDIEGLSTFEAFLKLAESVPEGGVRWASAEPLGEQGFIVEQLVIHPEPGTDESPVHLDRLVVNRIDLASAVSQQPPLFADLNIRGLRIPAEELATEDWAAYLDLTDLVLDLDLAYALDVAAGSLNLEQFRVELRNLGTLETRLHVLGIQLDEIVGAWLQSDPTRVTSSLANLELRYQDLGFLNAILKAVAADENQSLAGLIERLVGEMRAQSLDLGLAKDPLAQSVLAATEQFLRDIPVGTGWLSLRLNPPQPLDPLTALILLAAPDQAAARLGISVEYQK